MIATIYGREGDDFNGNGNDTIRGGSGFDTVTFNRDLDAYEIDFSADSVFVTDLVGSGGTNELMGVERIVFADGEILV